MVNSGFMASLNSTQIDLSWFTEIGLVLRWLNLESCLDLMEGLTVSRAFTMHHCILQCNGGTIVSGDVMLK